MAILNKIKFIYALSFLGFVLIEAREIDHFPDDFLFGFATSSYQIEGGWNEDGKGENVWDRFVHTKPKRVLDKSNGDITCDSYHKHEEDIKMLKGVGAQVYRFSISWSRILPKGDISQINEPGIKYYDNLINALLVHEIQPMVTLFHWDLPQPLQDLGGWPNPLLTEYFEDYARLVFRRFGDRVKWWITFNEPFETCYSSYGSDDGAPSLNMSGIADYLCAHTLIQSHARAYHIYKDEFENRQKGKVGITLNGGWNEPGTDKEEDKLAAERAMEFQIGWFLHPILKGDYPPIMRQRVDFNSKKENRTRSRLPKFTDYWRQYIKGTIDFLGVNHYSTYLTTSAKHSLLVPSFLNDMSVKTYQNKSWPGSSVPWLKIEPTGFRKKLNWIKNYTNNFTVFITENGYADKGELKDHKRIFYHRGYLKELLKAINVDNCNVIGYNTWSLMDNFEWLSGYTAKFGIYYVDFKHPNRTRTAKASVEFFEKLISTRSLPVAKKTQ